MKVKVPMACAEASYFLGNVVFFFFCLHFFFCFGDIFHEANFRHI